MFESLIYSGGLFYYTIAVWKKLSHQMNDMSDDFESQSSYLTDLTCCKIKHVFLSFIIELYNLLLDYFLQRYEDWSMTTTYIHFLPFSPA